MDRSPIERLLAAIDNDDVDAAAALMAPDALLLLADGRRAHGRDAAREVLAALLAGLRSTSHRITAQWHLDGVWIAEVEADYELRDYLQMNGLPRAFVARGGAEGITDLRVYGAHEHALAEHRSGEEGMRVGGRWIPPL